MIRCHAALSLTLLAAAAATVAEARRGQPAMGIYVPAFFKRVPPAHLFDDPRGGAASFLGSYHGVDADGQPERMTLAVEGGELRVVRQRWLSKLHHLKPFPVPGATIAGNQLTSPSLRGRFVLVPYQVERRFPGKAPLQPDGQPRVQVDLMCRAGLLLDDYRQLLQRDEPPVTCPPVVERAVAAGTLVPRRLLVEGRWALVTAEAPVRSRPLPGAAVIGTVYKGDEVDAIERAGEWILIHGGGVEGFVPAPVVANP